MRKGQKAIIVTFNDNQQVTELELFENCGFNGTQFLLEKAITLDEALKIIKVELQNQN